MATQEDCVTEHEHGRGGGPLCREGPGLTTVSRGMASQDGVGQCDCLVIAYPAMLTV